MCRWLRHEDVVTRSQRIEHDRLPGARMHLHDERIEVFVREHVAIFGVGGPRAELLRRRFGTRVVEIADRLQADWREMQRRQDRPGRHLTSPDEADV